MLWRTQARWSISRIWMSLRAEANKRQFAARAHGACTRVAYLRGVCTRLAYLRGTCPRGACTRSANNCGQ